MIEQQQIQLSPEILTRLDALASKLGVTAQYLWGVLINQAKVEIIQDSIQIGIGLCMVASSFHFLRQLRKFTSTVKERQYFNDLMDEGPRLAGFGVAILGLFIGGIALIVDNINIITPIVNPEYWALQQVLNVIK